MAQIVLEHVEKVYSGGVKALDDLNLEVKEGEFMVLVGPSGCGKSTALRSIAGLEEITDGTISIGEQVVNDLPPKDRDIAMVFQNYALYPHMTVEDNLAFGLKLRHTPKAEIKRRVGEAAALLGLEPYLNRKPAALSGGQRQRVAMGRAIVREPQAFLMDEPLSNLDAKLRVSMRAALNQLHERLGITTVYVTHDQVEAMTLGDRVCVMRDGRIQQVDTPAAAVRVAGQPVRGGLHRLPRDELRAGLARPRRRRGDGQLRRLPAAGARRRCSRPSPASTGYLGKQIILGVRPSDFEDAAFGDASWARFPVTVGVTEELGTEIHAIFTIDAPPVEHASIASAVRRLLGGGRDGHRAGRRQDAVDRAGVLAVGRPVRAAARARRRHQPPALLRPGQRRVDRPPADGGHPGGRRRVTVLAVASAAGRLGRDPP